MDEDWEDYIGAFYDQFDSPEREGYSGPIGPAPEGWKRVSGCSRVIPHNESYHWENSEMNADHYREN